MWELLLKNTSASDSLKSEMWPGLLGVMYSPCYYLKTKVCDQLYLHVYLGPGNNGRHCGIFSKMLKRL